MADGGFGCLWGGGYRVREREIGEGKRRQAHRDAAGWLSGLGDAPEPTNLTKMAGGSEVEDDGDGGDAGLPEGCGTVGRKRGSRRSLWASWKAAGMLVAAVVASGVDGSTRWRCGSEHWGERERGERGERCKGLRGVRGALGCLQRRVGKEEVAGACRRAVGICPRVLLSRGGRRLADGCVGWASQQLGRGGAPGKWA